MSGTARINLLPAERRLRRASRTALARWAVAIGLLSVAASGPATALALAGPATDQDLQRRAERASRAIAALEAREPVLRRRIADLQRTDGVLTAVEDRVDWRPLLHTVAERSGGARFERIDLEYDREEARVTLRVIGLAESLAAARELVLNFESTGAFREVSLAGTSKVGLVRRDVVRFEIKAVAAGAEKGRKP